MASGTKVTRDDEPVCSEANENKKADLTAEELAKLRAELRLRQKASMVCATLFNIISCF